MRACRWCCRKPSFVLTSPERTWLGRQQSKAFRQQSLTRALGAAFLGSAPRMATATPARREPIEAQRALPSCIVASGSARRLSQPRLASLLMLATVLMTALRLPAAEAYIWHIDETYDEEKLSFSELYMVRHAPSPRLILCAGRRLRPTNRRSPQLTSCGVAPLPFV